MLAYGKVDTICKFTMKYPGFLTLVCFISLATSAQAAIVVYSNGVNNTADASGPNWVYLPSPPYAPETPSVMFRDIIHDYGSSEHGPSGASADSQSGFSIFGGAGYDITQLSWQIGVVGGNDTDAAMTLYTGPGTATVSPTTTTEGKEDYRYDDAGGTAAKNLVFYYDDGGGPDEWASGYITRFITTVTDIAADDATAVGDVVLTNFTAAGEDFFNEIMTLSGGSGEIIYTADSFVPVVIADPATFTSAGSWTVIPEPSTWAASIGAMALTVVFTRRRRSR